METIVKKEGYMYIYLSNEHDKLVDVFFDDLTIVHKKSPIVQTEDYYPFGLTFNQQTREGTQGQNYLFTNKERQVDLELNLDDFGWRNYDPAIGRFNAIDLFSDKYYDINPYQYAANNPIKFVDINGDSLMLFKNGVYVSTIDNGKKETTGFNQQSTIDEDGNETFTGAQNFSFNDLDLDREGLKSGDMKLNFISQEEVSGVMDKSGIGDKNVFSRWGYAITESNSLNKRGDGRMDFLTTNNDKLSYKRLNIINGIGYNVNDAGNYLWGYSMGTMSFTSIMSRTAAHMNAWWSAKTSNPGMASTNSNPIMRWFENRSWSGDAAADQRAIQNGLNDSGSYWKSKKKSIQKIWK